MGDTTKNTEGENKKSSLSFLKSVSNYFGEDLSLAKIKIEDKLKSIAFDSKNNRLTVMSYDRVMYFIDIPVESIRHITEAEVRTF
jgi:hypothetical protein